MLNKHFILHLSLIEGVGPGVVQKIICNQRSDVTASDFYLFSAAQWMHYCGVTPSVAQKLVAGLASKKMLEEELYLIEKHQIQWVTVLEDDYPVLLKQIHMPPSVLYYRMAAGALHGFNSFNSSHSALAIVGSRAANAYGNKVVTTLIPELVASGITIVSGGALGIDTLAHETTIKHSGSAIAVLGSGLLKEYPAQNRKLFRSIVENNGVMASIFPLRAEPLPGNFPARNRVIAGLSQGCLVVQAAQKSGALITAQYALEQGRDVFAVPGAIDDPLSAGCHSLIQQGAKLTTSAQDIIQELGCTYIPVVRDVQTTLHQSQQEPQGSSISEEKAKIIAACKQALSLDDIIMTTGLELSVVQSELFDMQLEGMVEQDFTGMWIATRFF